MANKRLSDTAALVARGPSGGTTSVNVRKLDNGYIVNEYDENYNCRETFHEMKPTISVSAPSVAAAGDGLAGAKAALSRGRR